MLLGIGVQYRLQNRLQTAACDFLSDAIGDGWNAERTLAAAIPLWNRHPLHRRRKIAHWRSIRFQSL